MTRLMLLTFLLLNLMLAMTDGASGRADDAHGDDDSSDLEAGHSTHGEAFNEGPRQAAYRMEGMGSTKFASSAVGDTTQTFIDQGVAQLHGFWYFEAERSFRQAAMLEPELAIAYWGMAMANTNNSARAIGLVDEAEKHLGKATDREKAYVKSFAKYLRAGKTIDENEKLSSDDKKSKRREREENYIKDLERIIDKSPEDVDAHAFLALQIWTASRNSLPITSHYAVDGLLDRVFKMRPDHPAHHYRIHLWDNRRPENALASAAQCGPSLPGIAHMWHMPGHIYSRLHRYRDAAWQQEASARVDHAHMMRDRVMPDQIHNFAHNNEWLTRNLLFVGQVHEAIAQAENLISLPRHPKYNSLAKGGSSRFGRERLLDACTQYEMWDELIAACDGSMLPTSDDFDDRVRRDSWLIVALRLSGNATRASELLRAMRLERNELQRALITASGTQPEVGDDKSDDKKDAGATSVKLDTKKTQAQIKRLGEAISLGVCAAAVRKKDAALLEKHLPLAGKVDGVLKAHWLSHCGKDKPALESIRKFVKDSPGQVRPQAMLVELLWKTDDREAATVEFEKLRTLAAVADLDAPIFERLCGIATELKLAKDWRAPATVNEDLGPRPPLDSLGPKHWTPYQMPEWKVLTAGNREVSSKSVAGQPRIVIFYLGFGCLHCIEQLAEFSPRLEEFKRAGIDVMAISTETAEDLRTGIENFDQSVAIPLHSDSELLAFKSFRCLDDFEKTPLHGTFLVDAEGRVRWQDIGHEPFMDVEFLLAESQRLLRLPMAASGVGPLARSR